MLDLILDSKEQPTLRVLCVGAHCDDIEIGCAATLLALQGRGKRLVIDWVVLSGTAKRRKETGLAMRMLVLAANRGKLLFGDFPDGQFPAAYGEIKDFCERLKRLPGPDLILCHERDDRHQDHRIVNEVIWNTFRDHVILEYEIPKWDGGLGQPIIQTHLRRLIQVLLKGLNHSGQPLMLRGGERDEFETKLLAAHPADRRLLDADGRRLLRDFDQ